MRIAQVLHWFLPRHLAGTEVYTYHLARALQAEHDVHLFCREDGHHDRPLVEADEIYDGIPVRRIYYNTRGWTRIAPGRIVLRFQNAAVEQSFARFLDETAVEIVHFQHLLLLSGGLIAVARERGIPAVVTLHDYWFQCHNTQLLRPDSALCSGPARGIKCTGCADIKMPYPARFMLGPVLAPYFVYRTAYLRRHLEMANLVITPSAFVRDRFVDQGFPAERILVSDNGTADGWLAEYRPVRSERLRFGYIGALMYHKGVHVLVEAFRQMPGENVELHLFGDPDYAPDYYSRLRSLARDPRIQFRGRFENRDIGRVLSEIDVLVVPSVWYENSPVTIHEARFGQVPVIASQLGGIPEFVEHETNGLLFRAGDASDLRAQMQRMVEEPGLLARLRRAIQPVKSIRENALELEGIYQRLITGEGP